MFQILLKVLFVAISVASAAGEETNTFGPDSLGHKCNYSGPGHCPSGFVCKDGGCTRRCLFKGKCPEGFSCKGNFVCLRNECAARDPNCCANCLEKCAKHLDCPSAGWGCVLNKCRRVECHVKADCPFEWPCLVGKCFPPGCKTGKDCPGGWRCGEKRRCVKEEAKGKAKRGKESDRK
uniref:Uncharacterized protein n=1 Tax=Globodera rostochiensis TaxID=31243 RepID=A0A914H316_GLORO